MIFTRSRAWASTCAVFLALSAPAMALDGKQFLSQFNATYFVDKYPAARLSAAAINENGGRIVLEGARIGWDGKTFDIGDVTFSGVREKDDGGYSIGRIDVADFNLDLTGKDGVKRSVSINGFHDIGTNIPGPSSATDDLDSVINTQEIHIGPIALTVDGKELFSIDQISAAEDVSDDRRSALSYLKVSGIEADFPPNPNPEASKIIDTLGLARLSGKIDIQFSWDIDTGNLDIKECALDFDGIGRLDTAFSMSGWTLDTFKKYAEMGSQQVRHDPENGEDIDPMVAAMGEILSNLSFTGTKIRFDDAGITKRVLDLAGKGMDYFVGKNDLTGVQVARMIKIMTPIFLSQTELGIPLRNEIAAAVDAYLDNPKSVTIAARPQNPVPLPTLFLVAKEVPQALPYLTGLTVTANQ